MLDQTYQERVHIKILGGLEVTMLVDMHPAEPDEGLTNDWLDHWEIIEINECPVAKPPEWLHKRIRNTLGEERRIIEAIYDELRSF